MTTKLSSPIVDTSQSPHSVLRPISVSDVRLTDTFWEPRRRINREATIPSQYQHCVETNRLRNFERAAGKTDEPFEGIFFNDSDVYKWLEAASWSLASDPDLKLDATCDRVIEIIGAAQRPDGYLNTYYSRERENERWTNLKDMHELYCAGHYIQAAIAHNRATRKDSALSIAVKLADCICRTFGEGENQLRLVDGHEEIEMALVELARVTGDAKYLRQARFFIDLRGQGTIEGRAYNQDHKPIREMERMIGHAVRAVYYTCGAADILAETGDATLKTALERLWDNMVNRQMYISGGIGQHWEGEAFGYDYELPNERAYAETCAAIGSVMWNWRMLLATGESRYADIMELALYNGVMSGLSLDGKEYFYQNPLADDGLHRRQPWFGCACCPPNVARLLAQLPGYFYATSDQGIFVNLYAQSEATLPVGEGNVTLRQTANYPWNGEIEIQVETGSEREFTLSLRAPGWASDVRIAVNGIPQQGLEKHRYHSIRRAWKSGDRISLSLGMPVRRIKSHPYVLENTGRIALMRGPLLYCLEASDNPGADLREIALPASEPIEARERGYLLGGIVALSGRARQQEVPGDWSGDLYREERAPAATDEQDTVFTAIPYYAWANREPGQMQVWIKG